jgi:hypothetical protein
MAERRMFAKTIIDSDAFLDMPLSSQALYFHLSMRADDDGFLNNAKKIQRTIGSADDDLKILFAKNFIIPFESGVCVIKHWMIHNMIQKDRYKPTMYGEEKDKLSIKNNKSYTMLTECIHDGNSLEAQVRLGKASLGEVSEVESSVKKEKIKGSRLSQDWVIPDEYIEFCKTKRPDLDVQLVADNFKDFWISKSGSDATKLDWFATWRSWVRKERVISNVKKPMKGYGFISDAEFNDWLDSAPIEERIANERLS